MTLTLILAFIPTVTPTTIPSLTSRPEKDISIRFIGLSSVTLPKQFLAINSLGSILLRHVGRFGISEHKYVDPNLTGILRTFSRKILKIWASKLVKAM